MIQSSVTNNQTANRNVFSSHATQTKRIFKTLEHSKNDKITYIMSTNSFLTPKEKAPAKKARPKSVLKDTIPTPRFRGIASTSHMHTATSPRQWQPWTLVSVIESAPFRLGYAIWWVSVTRGVLLRILGGLGFAVLRILALFQTKKCHFSDLA